MFGKRLLVTSSTTFRRGPQLREQLHDVLLGASRLSDFGSGSHGSDRLPGGSARAAVGGTTIQWLSA